MINKPTVVMLPVTEEYVGQRLDNFLMRHLKGVPKSYIYRIIRKGEVRINKKRVKPMVKLQLGDVIRIPPVRYDTSIPPSAPQHRMDELLKQVIYEDDHYLIINKPSGIAVHGGSGISLGVIELLRQAREDLHYLELAHRLDRATSGCLVLAKKANALRAINQQLKDRVVDKRYLCLVQGNMKGSKSIVDAALEKNTVSSGERIVRVSSEGKSAETEFRVKERFKGATLLLALPRTGRTHQIRVHARHLKHPIAGDEKYGDRDFNKKMRQMGLKRLFLHAQSIAFTHPETQEQIKITAELDDSLINIMQALS